MPLRRPDGGTVHPESKPPLSSGSGPINLHGGRRHAVVLLAASRAAPLGPPGSWGVTAGQLVTCPREGARDFREPLGRRKERPGAWSSAAVRPDLQDPLPVFLCHLAAPSSGKGSLGDSLHPHTPRLGPKAPPPPGRRVLGTQPRLHGAGRACTPVSWAADWA